MADENAIQIDIEVSTSSLKEIQDILKEIREAESKLQTLKTDTTTNRLRGRLGKVPLGEGGPEDINRVEPETGGIFGGQIGEEALQGGKPRDVKSRSPAPIENRFRKLEEQVEEQRDLLSTGLGLAGTAGGLVGTLSHGGVIGFFEKIFKSKIGKAAIAIAIAEALITQIADILQSPGNIFDRRFRRIIKNEVSGLTDREEKAAISQGFRQIIVTTKPGLRTPRGQAVSNLDYIANYQTVFDKDLQYIAGRLPH